MKSSEFPKCTTLLPQRTGMKLLLIPAPLRVQVPNSHILTQNLYYNYYYPKPKYQIIGYLDPLGSAKGRIVYDCFQAIPWIL